MKLNTEKIIARKDGKIGWMIINNPQFETLVDGGIGKGNRTIGVFSLIDIGGPS